MVKKQILVSGLFIASVLVAVFAVFFPAISFVAVYAASLLCALSMIYVKQPWIQGIGSLVVFVAAWAISGSASAALLFLLLFLPIGVALGLSFKAKLQLNESVSFAVLNSVVFGVVALLVFIGEFSEGSFDIKSVLEPIFLTFKDNLQAAFTVNDQSFVSLFETMGVSVEQYVDYIYLNVIYNIPTFFVCFILFISVIVFWTLKAIFKRTPVKVDFMGRFDGCRISPVGAILYSVSTLLYLFSSTTAFGVAVSNFSNVMTYVMAYAGISLIAYFLDFKNFSPFIKNALIIVSVAVCLIPGGFLNIIALLGFLDSCWNIREKLSNSGF